MANDAPRVTDNSTLTGVFNADSFRTIGVEGRKDTAGTAVVALPTIVSSAAEADTLFGPVSLLSLLVKFILARGISSVVAVASKDNAAPLLADRQASWAALEDDPTIRIRLTDSVVQADHVALADSCENADEIHHKQYAYVGMAAATSKASLLAAGAAIASKRAILVGPAIYDLDGTLRAGQYAAAYAACEDAKNPDITDSMNLAEIPATAGIELETATGLPLFRLRSNGGTPLDDFQDLLDGGVSPFGQASSGKAAFSHLRMTYTTDDTYDALMTLLIKDETFLGVKETLLSENFLRSGNTLSNRSRAAAIVDAWLKAHDSWVEPIELANGTIGYGVTVVPSADLKSFEVSYFGGIVRGTNVIQINGTLTVPV